MNREHWTRRGLLCAGGTIAACSTLPKQAGWRIRGEHRPLRFAFLTDIHTHDDPHVADTLARAVIGIRQANVDFAVGGGDFIDKGFSSTLQETAPRWQMVRSFLGDLNKDVYPVLGNHDLVGVAVDQDETPTGNPRASFLDFFGRTRSYYSFVRHGYRFIVLDSIEVDDQKKTYRGAVDPAQLAWLDELLANTPRTQPLILVSHVPLFTLVYQATQGATAAAPENRITTNATDVLKRLRRHNLVLTLQGHLHVDEQLRWRGTMFTTGGAICGKWWRGDHLGTAPGFGVVTLKQNQAMWEYHPVEPQPS